MKVICVEEHISTPAMARAVMPKMLEQAPYLPHWGKNVTDNLGESDPSRPHVISNQLSLQKLLEVGEKRVQEMDKFGIDMQAISYAGLPQLIEGSEGVALAQKANDEMAEKIRQFPDRFIGFATLPWQNTEEALAELVRVKQLGFRGVLLNGRPSDDFLDHPRYLPILAKIAELDFPLFLHPGLAYPQVQQAYYQGFNEEVEARFSMFAWGWHNELGIQLIRLMLAGVFDKLPKLNVIIGHWGELVPFYLQRLDDSIPTQATGLTRTISQTFCDQVYVTPSGMMSEPHFQFVKNIVGIDRLLFSCDYPYLSLNGAIQWLQNLPISEQERTKFAYQNAEKLFNL